MAQNKNVKKSEGLCQKIHSAVSPFRTKARRISHHPQGPISIIHNTKLPLPGNTQNPIRISSPQKTERVRVLHQPSLSKMIPVEFEPEKDVAETEVAIVTSRKLKKVYDRPKSDDDLVHENEFSDYISKVKDRLMKTASNVSDSEGGVDEGETTPVRDSFNDKVTNYINRARIKVRKTTTVGDDKSFPLN